ncbi:MAG: T9SS type A sorting domain-containing protein [Saprospiraceae bacterium]
MKHLALFFTILPLLVAGQYGTCFEAPEFNFSGTPVTWFHRISDPSKDSACINIIYPYDQLEMNISPLSFGDKFIVVYDNGFYGIVIRSYEIASGNIEWTQSFNRTVNEEARGTAALYLEAEGSDQVKMIGFQSFSKGGSAGSKKTGFLSKRIFDVNTGIQTEYVLNKEVSERIIDNKSSVFHKVLDKDLLFHYDCNYFDNSTSFKCIPKYNNAISLREEVPPFLPDTIVFQHFLSDSTIVNYYVSGPVVENDQKFIYLIKYFYNESWHHEMWKTDDFGNVKWRKDFTHLMKTDLDPKGVVFEGLMGWGRHPKGIRIFGTHSITPSDFGHRGYIDFDFEGNLIKDRLSMVIDNKKVGHIKSVTLRNGRDVLHCIRFIGVNNLYFYKETESGEISKTGKLIYQGDDLFALLPIYISQTESEDIIVNASFRLDSIISNQNFVHGGWSYDFMIKGSDLGITTNTLESFFPNINLTPNPTSGIITIKNLNQSASVKIHDISGRLIQSYENIWNNLDISDLPSGMYILDINNDTIHERHKVVKM